MEIDELTTIKREPSAGIHGVHGCSQAMLRWGHYHETIANGDHSFLWLNRSFGTANNLTSDGRSLYLLADLSFLLAFFLSFFDGDVGLALLSFFSFILAKLESTHAPFLCSISGSRRRKFHKGESHQNDSKQFSVHHHLSIRSRSCSCSCR